MRKNDKIFLNIFGIILMIISLIAFVGFLMGYHHQGVVSVFFGIASIIAITGNNDEQH